MRSPLSARRCRETPATVEVRGRRGHRSRRDGSGGEAGRRGEYAIGYPGYQGAERPTRGAGKMAKRCNIPTWI